MKNSTLKALVACCSCAPYEMKSGPVTPSCPAVPRVRVDQRSAGLGWAGLGWAGLGLYWGDTDTLAQAGKGGGVSPSPELM